MPGYIYRIVCGSVAALIGLAIAFAIIGAPKLLETKPIAEVAALGIKVVGLFAPLYIAGTFAYGGVIIWVTSLFGLSSLVVYLVLGVLPALMYAGFALIFYGLSSGWHGALVLHGLPCLAAAFALWLTKFAWRPK